MIHLRAATINGMQVQTIGASAKFRIVPIFCKWHTLNKKQATLIEKFMQKRAQKDKDFQIAYAQKNQRIENSEDMSIFVGFVTQISFVGNTFI